jgi:hypothetical protein
VAALSTHNPSTSTPKSTCGDLDDAGAAQFDWQQSTFEDHGHRYLPVRIGVEHRRDRGWRTRMQEPVEFLQQGEWRMDKGYWESSQHRTR